MTIKWIKKIIQKICQKYKKPLIDTLIDTYCIGKGIEIGPGKKPYCTRNVIYLDKYPKYKVDIQADAAQMPVRENCFDFLFSSHCLEHCPNLLKVLYEWKRIITPGGILFLVLPHCNRTRDRHREKTKLDHYIKDYETISSDYDDFHIEEMRAGYSKLEDLEKQKKSFGQRLGFDFLDFNSRIKYGAMHYHVFTQNEMIDVLKYIGMEILYVAEKVPERHDSFLMIAKK